jgi:hypothetical protein
VLVTTATTTEQQSFDRKKPSKRAVIAELFLGFSLTLKHRENASAGVT